MRHAFASRPLPALLAVLLLVSAPGCSVRRLAVNKVADALTGSGTTFASDNDPELIRDALPFSLKLMESLLAENPTHLGLLGTLAGGFTRYAYAFVHIEAEEIEDDDLDRSRALQLRARKLYLRARDYGLRGLDVRHPGFTTSLASTPAAATALAGREDVPFLYWSAVAWAAAIALAKDDPALVGDLPKVEALIDRALHLDEAWNFGSIHQFLITFEMSRATGDGDPVLRATRHFERAAALTQDRFAGPYVSFAEAVCIPTEDRARFEQLLHQALEIDVNTEPSARLENLVMQRRARWLLNRVDKLFLPPLQ